MNFSELWRKNINDNKHFKKNSTSGFALMGQDLLFMMR